jgi:hypothetical protein
MSTENPRDPYWDPAHLSEAQDWYFIVMFEYMTPARQDGIKLPSKMSRRHFRRQ